jgi:hypothetical protein
MMSQEKNNKLSLTECKRILALNGLHHSDEQIIKIRDWLEHFAEMSIEALENHKKGIQ